MGHIRNQPVSADSRDGMATLYNLQVWLILRFENTHLFTYNLSTLLPPLKNYKVSLVMSENVFMVSVMRDVLKAVGENICPSSGFYVMLTEKKAFLSLLSFE